MSDIESGYASGSSSHELLPAVAFSKPHLRFLNKQLNALEPQDILKWSLITLPALYQTTAFGLSGLVTVDMLSKLDLPLPHGVDLVFLDTLYHFPETLALIERVKQRYPNVRLHVYRPLGVSSTAEFESQFGPRLWETDEQRYEWAAKVEPQERAYRELGVGAVLTGRRRSQGAARGALDVLEVDEGGRVKVNPLANWTYEQVWQYVRQHDVPYNALKDRGYKSVGDWHSTQPVAEGEDERAGRWKGTPKTECGIHNPRSKYAQFLREQELKKQGEALHSALSNVQAAA